MEQITNANSVIKELMAYAHQMLVGYTGARVRVRHYPHRGEYSTEIHNTIGTVSFVDAHGGIHFLSGKTISPLDIIRIERISNAPKQ